MVSLQISCHSSILRTDVPIQVLLPHPSQEESIEGKIGETAGFPVLYLLHGLSEDQTAWVRHTAIERYAHAHGMAVVMPAAGRSFYTDMRQGTRYGQFIADELPFLVKSLFRLSDRREDTFIAGQDMGGYGAFKTAIAHPERYAAAASLSGALDLGTLYELPDDEIRQELFHVFGSWDECLANGHHLPELLERTVRAGTKLPKLFQCCGSEDFLLEDNRRFASTARRLGTGLQYLEGPGEHDWAYWDGMLPRMLDLMHPCPPP